MANKYRFNGDSRERHVNTTRRDTATQDLMDSLERFWRTEMFGIKSTSKPMTDEDQRAVKLLESSIVKTTHRYEVGLLWRNDSTPLPNNRDTALKRFYGLEKRLRRDPDYGHRYENAINQYVKLGHAKLAGRPGFTWYLPHHGVEQSGKLRAVFDAPAQYLGHSLNDHLLQGPHLMTPLFGVLLRFREYAHAVSADIEKIFNQVRVKSTAADYTFKSDPCTKTCRASDRTDTEPRTGRSPFRKTWNTVESRPRHLQLQDKPRTSPSYTEVDS